jgi:VWFA-related protein
MRFLKSLSVLLLLGALAPCLSMRAGAAGQAPQPTFRSGVELVEVPVLVRDRDGRFVADLTRDDFRLLEEGAPQAITFFERVAIPVLPAPPLLETAIPRDVATNDVALDARLFVLVLDGLHVAPHRVQAVKKYARQFIERHVGPTDLAAVVSPGALASATQDFTSDKARLIAAVDQFSGNKLRSATVERDEQERKAGGGALYQGRDPSDDERVNRVQSLVGVLEALAGHLATVERRRKSLLLFSEGIDYNTGDLGGFSRGLQRHAAEVTVAMDRSISALVRASVAMYSIDPRGLSSAEGDGVEAPIHREISSSGLADPGVRGEYAESIRNLRHLAEATGGFAAVDRNDFTGAFDRILRESSEYYVLGYVPAKPPKPGEVRRLEVRVARPEVTVVARKVYAAARNERRDPIFSAPADPALPGMPPLGRRAPAIDPLSSQQAGLTAARGLASELGALLASPLPRPGLPLRVQAIPFRSDGRRHEVTLIIEVSGRSLTFLERDGRFHERIQMALLTVDDRARGSNGSSTTLDLRLTREELDRVKATAVRWLSRISLPPGRHQIRVAARAERTSTSGSAALDVDVPRFERDRLSLSGIALTSLPSALPITRGEAKVPTKFETPPATSRTFVVGDRLTSAVEVYVPATSAGDVGVLAWIERIDGATGADTPLRTQQRVARKVGNDDPQEVAFTFDTAALVPGRYVLHIVAQPAGSPERTERTVPFDIVAPSG